jgi:hypothetical protein
MKITFHFHRVRKCTFTSTPPIHHPGVMISYEDNFTVTSLLHNRVDRLHVLLSTSSVSQTNLTTERVWVPTVTVSSYISSHGIWATNKNTYKNKLAGNCWKYYYSVEQSEKEHGRGFTIGNTCNRKSTKLWKTRLKRRTLSSTPTFQRRSSRHITQVALALSYTRWSLWHFRPFLD